MFPESCFHWEEKVVRGKIGGGGKEPVIERFSRERLEFGKFGFDFPAERRRTVSGKEEGQFCAEDQVSCREPPVFRAGNVPEDFSRLHIVPQKFPGLFGITGVLARVLSSASIGAFWLI